MIFLVRHAAELFAEHIESGVCVEHELVLPRYNEAVRRLVQTDDPQHTIDRMMFYTKNNSISLPRQYVAARLANINGYHVDIMNQGLEFVAAGPGENDWYRCAQLVDQGAALTYFDIPPEADNWYIMAYSTSANDAEKTITFRAIDSTGGEVLTSTGSPDQALAITQWSTGVEGVMSATPTAYFATPVKKITAIRLPAGLEGYVTLLAYQPSTKYQMFLSKYHPSETTPSYRRYRLPWFDYTNGVCVSLLCKKQYLPAVSLDDVMLVQNPDAVKMMVMSIESENRKDINGAVAFKQLAVNQVREQMSNESRGSKFIFQGWDDSSGVSVM